MASGASAQRFHVLVVEDDPSTAAGTVRGLRGAGFEVDLATDGREAMRRIAVEPYDLVVLDLMLPEASGFDVLEKVRHRAACPIIALTARTALPDRLRAFELGAADYLAKPFWMEELIARIRLRLHVGGEAPRRIVRWASVALDLDARTVQVGGRPAALTPTEFALLTFLVERRGRAVSRNVLAEHALASLASLDGETGARTVDSHVARVRKKLGAGGAAIATVWGIGYRFETEEDA
jgi:two-component system OmpR family response regulator